MIDTITSAVLKFLGSHVKLIVGIVVNLILIWGFCKLIDLFGRKLVYRLKAKNSDSPLLNLMPVLNRTAKAIVVFILLAGFLQSFGYNVASLIAGFGITGLAVGFAAKEAIGNIFGSFGLLADRVYKIGEYIKFNGFAGTVENINLRSTTIRDDDGFAVNVPNNLLANEEIVNVSQAKGRRIDITVGIEYGTSNEKIDRACEILREVARRDSTVLEGEHAFLENLDDSAITVRLVCFTTKTSWGEYIYVKSGIIREIIHRYRAEGIEFAFPSTSVYMAKEASEVLN